MNLPNKITSMRIVMTIFIIIILLFPFDSLGISSTKLFINESIVVDLKYLISGVIFIIASLSDFFDGYIARKYNLITDLGKTLDLIADKFLFSSILIILAAQGLIHPLIPVIIITMDAITDSVKIVVSRKVDSSSVKNSKIKVIMLILGITLTLFNNLPFELINFKFSDVLLIIATSLSVYDDIEYCKKNKNYILKYWLFNIFFVIKGFFTKTANIIIGGENNTNFSSFFYWHLNFYEL